MAKLSNFHVYFKPSLLMLAASFAAPASAAKQPDQRVAAVVTEWYLANCGASGLPDAMISASSMIIDGSERDEIDRLREEMREKVKSRFSDTEAACADLKSVLERTFQQ